MKIWIWEDLKVSVSKMPEYFKSGLFAEEILHAAAIGEAQQQELIQLRTQRMGEAGERKQIIGYLKQIRDLSPCGTEARGYAIEALAYLGVPSIFHNPLKGETDGPDKIEWSDLHIDQSTD